MSSFRVCPTSKPGVTRMEFDYYHDKDGEEFEQYIKFVRKVALEDFELCETAQSNLERGVYSQGVLNVKKEGGVLRKCSSLGLLLHMPGLVGCKLIAYFQIISSRSRSW